jgi:hypothetical protein
LLIEARSSPQAAITDPITMSESKSTTPKRQLIEDIRQYNASASPKFLEQFDDDALAQYRDHLKAAKEKQVRIHGWVRPQTKLRMVS